MVVWRPARNIQLKALGLNWRDGKLLAAEVLDDPGRVKGVRPLGGTVEFGETAEQAVKREFEEELGIRVAVAGAPIFMENIFTHEGQIGHEVLAIFEVTFPVGSFARETHIAFTEDNGLTWFAEWFALDSLDLPDGPQLFPTELKAFLLQ